MHSDAGCYLTDCIAQSAILQREMQILITLSTLIHHLL